jgi:DNA-binding response OmpR family regulator
VPVYKTVMAANSTLLCIHRDPAQLSLLERSGFELLTATNGHDGLRLFMSQPVDAIVLDYHLGLLDGGVVAAEIKKVKPQVPIVMLAQSLELPVSALSSVDAIVAKSDGPDLLLATIRSVLDPKLAPPRAKPVESHPQTLRRRPASSWDGKERRRANIPPSAAAEK